MVDTTQTHQPMSFVWSKIPPDYFYTYRRPPKPDASSFPNNGQTFDIDDPATGYHGHGQDRNGERTILYHRTSLPRLRHGSNRCLIKNQAELDAALALHQALADKHGTPLTSQTHFTRVDLVWHFPGDTAQFVRAHLNNRHPGVRSDPKAYSARSVAFNGSGLRIIMYDKVLKDFKVPGNIVRVEVQLRKDRLIKELGHDGQRVRTLSFDHCYQVYRRILLRLCPSDIPKCDGIAEFLAIARRERWHANGVPAFDIYTQNTCSKTILRLEREMAALRPQVFGIDWRQLLPADGPPPAIDVELPEEAVS